jgi:hypothetical protein
MSPWSHHISLHVNLASLQATAEQGDEEFNAISDNSLKSAMISNILPY